MPKLTTAARKKLPKSDFVEKSARKYPIPDAAHMREMLWRGARESRSTPLQLSENFQK